MGDWIHWPPTWATLLLLPALFAGFTVHELAHALVAYLLGDTSQVERKRLSFNPLRHVSWLGIALFLLLGFGWAKPVMIEHRRFRLKNRAFGIFLVSISGAAANLLLGLLSLVGILATAMTSWTLQGTPLSDVFGFLFVSNPGPDLQGAAVALSYYMFVVNMLLAFFNLIPLPPLDGFQAAVSLFLALRTALGRGPAAEGRAYPTRRRWPEVWTRTGSRAGADATLEGDGSREPEGVAPGAQGAEGAESPAQIHFAIGLSYHKEGQLDEAIVRYRQATAHDEAFGLAYYNLGLAYWAKGRLPLAMSAFRAVLQFERDPVLLVQAERHLRILERTERGPSAQIELPPPPLEAPSAAGPVVEEAPPLDPALTRRLWLRLATGGIGSLCLAVGAWIFVTVVTLSALGQ
jgi:Zn-dependent protease